MSAPNLICAAKIEPRPVRWLWKARIPLGKVTVLVGSPDGGKSLLTLDIAARVTRPGTWPDGAAATEEAGSVILLSAEDDAEDTICPRLIAAGADLERVHILQSVLETGKDGGIKDYWPSLVHDLEAIRAALKGRPGTKLIVIDPITAYLDGTDAHKDAEVRRVLGPLAQLAAKQHVAVVCVMHTNKSVVQKAIHRVGGSIAFVAAARVALLVARDPNAPERHLVVRMKNSLSREQSGLAFRIQEVLVPPLPDGQPKIDWEAAPVDLDAEDVLRAEAATRENPSERDRATEWLRARLSGGPVACTEVEAEAKAAGVAQRTLERAKIDLGVRSRPRGSGANRKWFWEISDSDVAPARPPTSHPDGDGGLGGLGGLNLDFEEEKREQDRQGRQDRQEFQGEQVAAFDGDPASRSEKSAHDRHKANAASRAKSPLGAMQDPEAH